MTTVEKCRHDMVPAHCYWCGHPERPAARTRYGDGPPIRVTARYPGTCEICDLPIDPGQEIAAVEEGHWSHYDCIDAETADEGWWDQ